MSKSNYTFLKPLLINEEENRFLIMKANRDEVYEIRKTKNLMIFNKLNYVNSNILYKNQTPSSSYDCYGILGIFNSDYTDYLMIISEASLVGEILKSKIYKIETILFLPYENISNEMKRKDKKFIDMYDDFLSKNSLYFSDYYDMTNNFHDNIFKNAEDVFQLFQLKTIKENFCWNQHHMNNLKFSTNFQDNNNVLDLLNNSKGSVIDKSDKSIPIIPSVINGYVGIKKFDEYEKEFIFILIARKDKRRTGMRFLCRGADEDGNCANYVETEQIIVIIDKNINKSKEENYQVISHIQVRGSIPIKWSQPANFKFVPKIIISNDLEEDKSIMKKHVIDLNNNYGSAILINLIDQKGDQKELGDAFNNVYNSIVADFSSENKPEFIWFDFHHNCKGMKYENLSILLSSKIFKKFLIEKEYFHAKIPSFYNNIKKFNTKNLSEKTIQIINKQKGVFRINCIDCLDRTNIVQTLISRHFTHYIMKKMNICTNNTYTGKVFDKFRKNFEQEFKNLWSNHGDVLSNSYSGTQAQKSDFTRTGKRTYFGVFKDILIGTKRFFVNNINDFYFQECQNLFLNRISIKNMRHLSKPSQKIFYSLTILTVSYLIYWLSKMLKNRHQKSS